MKPKKLVNLKKLKLQTLKILLKTKNQDTLDPLHSRIQS